MTHDEIDLIKNTFDYDEYTGELIRKGSYHKRYIGRTLGCMNGRGYVLVRIGKKKYNVHRLAWIIYHGYNPDEIDHVNHNKSDNRLSNLREVSRKEQMKNRKFNSNNTSGHIGVSFEKGKWKAFISVNNERIHLGLFETINEAVAARSSAEKLYKFHSNHGIKI